MAELDWRLLPTADVIVATSWRRCGTGSCPRTGVDRWAVVDARYATI
jgi:hypothetical protein